jgi:hypothetical protein
MGAPDSGMQAAERPEADTLLSAFRTIASPERGRHARVLNYWLSIRGDKEFPPLHDLDPLELTDAGPTSILLELISGGHDAEIRHVGDRLKAYVDVERIIDAPSPSLLASIAKKLPIVAISRDFLAFEDEFSTPDGSARCWATLLPLSAGGAWVDYVYAFVSVEGAPAKAADPAKKPKKAEGPEAVSDPVEEIAEVVPEPEVADVAEVVSDPVEEAADEIAVAEVVPDPVEEIADVVPEEAKAVEEIPVEAVADELAVEESTDDETAEVASHEVEQTEPVAELADEPTEAIQRSDEHESVEAAAPAAKSTPGFAKLFDSLAGLAGFYGSEPVKVEPVVAAVETADEQPVEEQPVEEQPLAELVLEEPEVQQEPVDESAAEEVVPIEHPETQHAEQPAPALEGSLQSKLTDVRAKADEARAAKLRANAALYEGLAAAYDFALDAEDAPEEYLRLVEAQGLKIQLRAPMKPVVKLAFDGLCDDATIAQLEAVLAWALKEELPRGTLAERLEAEGGMAGVLNGAKKAA